MATAALVHQGAHRLRYLITAEGTGSETATITTIGGVTPDTLTDSLGSGVIKQLSKAVANGYGTLPAGGQTAPEARALWCSDLSGADPSSGSPNGSKLPTAKLTVTARSGAGDWYATASTDGGGNPVVQVHVEGGGVAYLDIEASNAIGV